MAEAKKKPAEVPASVDAPEQPKVVGVTYMMVPTGQRASETPLFAIRRVEFDGHETRSTPFDAVRPANRLVIRERLRVLLDGREVVQ